MSFGLPEPFTFYGLLRDQGSIIAGILALVAGFLALRAGQMQAAAVDRQNDQLRRSEKRGFARSSLIAARLLSVLIDGITQDVERELIYVKNHPSPNLEGDLARASWRRIRRPEISLIWQQLGQLDPEIIKLYMEMDRAIAVWQANETLAPAINDLLSALRTNLDQIRTLRGFIQSECERALAVLAD